MNMDQAILKAFPLLAAPASGELLQADCDGMRFLAARDGIWREVNLPWIKVRHQISDAAISLPYGALDPCVEYHCGAIPRDAIRRFVEEARQAVPTEIAAALIWNHETDGWRYARRISTSASADRIEYLEVRLGESEHLVVDVHSHGTAPAFFSPLDNKDDHGAMKVSLVLGNLDRAVPTSAMRLCMAGYIMPITMNADGVLEHCS